MVVKNYIVFLFGILVLSQFASAGIFNIFNVSNTNQSYFFVNGTSGNVGIGTTGPGAKLDIQASNVFSIPAGATYAPTIFAGRRAAGDLVSLGLGYDANHIRDISVGSDGKMTYWYWNGSSWSAQGAMDSSGNVGIGTPTPSSLFEVGKLSGVNEINLSGVMYVNSTSGNVGIGTTNPGYTLDVVGSIRGTGTEIVTTGNILTGTGGILYVPTIQSRTTNQNLELRADGSGDFLITTDADSDLNVGSGKLFVNGNTGNVGIGTTSPNRKLDVAGSGLFNLSSGGVFEIINNSNSSFVFVNGTSGNVGIGTTSPDTLLTVNGARATQKTLLTLKMDTSGAGANDEASLDFKWYNTIRSGRISGYTQSTDGAGSGGLKFYTSSAGTSYNTAPSMTLDKDGNVGIGTTSPNRKLDVAGSGIFNISSSGSFEIINNSNSSFVFVNGTSGNVGIGTTGPGAKLDVRDGNVEQVIRMKHTDSGTFDIGIDRGGTNFGFGVWSGATQIFDISSDGGVNVGSYAGVSEAPANGMIISGNVGIGTPTPSSLFEVGKLSGVNEINLSGVMYVNSTSGNLGIGTTGPGETLQVVGDMRLGDYTTEDSGATLNIEDSASPYVTIVDQGTGTFQLARDGNAYVAWDTGDLLFKYGITWNAHPSGSGTTGMIIKADGNVGIGTTSPNRKLDVAGSGIFNLSSSGSFEIINNSNSSFVFVNGTTGNVGIGTTAPGTLLEVQGSGDPRMRVKETGAAGTAGINLISRNGSFGATIRDDNTDLEFWTYNGASEQQRVTILGSSGNVGIGTTNPSSLFETNKVAGKNEINLSGVMYVNSTSGFVGIGTTTPGSLLNIYSSGADDAVMTFQTSGVGANPIFRIQSAANRGNQIFFSDGADAGQIHYGHDNDKMSFFTGGVTTADMVIDSSGNVGIGTASPNAKLQVESGNFWVNGSGSAAGLFYNASSGNLGIGTTSPSSKFEVNGTAGGFLIDVSGTNPMINTTSSKNVTITSSGGSVIIRLG